MNSPIFIFILLVFISSSNSINLNCEYKTENILRQQLKFCIAINNLNIFDPNTEISKIDGNILTARAARNITGLSIENKKTQYLPSNLGAKFTNLIALRVKNGRVKELVQQDLKSLTMLRYLNLDENDIETLNNDVFEFNEKLELIWFSNNKISRIGSTAFNHLKLLGNLDLTGNTCISKKASYNGSIPKFLVQIQQNCSGVEETAQDERNRPEFNNMFSVLDYGDEEESTTQKFTPETRTNRQHTQNEDMHIKLKANAEEELRRSQGNAQILKERLNNLNSDQNLNNVHKTQNNQNSWLNLELQQAKQENADLLEDLNKLKNQVDEQKRIAEQEKINYEREIKKLKNLLEQRKNELAKMSKSVEILTIENQKCQNENSENNFKKPEERNEENNEDNDYY